MSESEETFENSRDVDEQDIEMDAEHRKALQACREQIKKDLEVKYIVDSLIENKVIDSNLYDEILAKTPSPDQVEFLLDILPNRGQKAFAFFQEALRDDYEWLADDLENALSLKADGGVSLKSPAKESLVIEEVKSVEDRLKDALNRGGVPSRPSHHIIRDHEMKSLKEHLATLDVGEFLVLHGMPGSGKSVLAAEALRDPEITLDLFPDGVFWFRVGMLEAEKLLIRMKILLEKLNASQVSAVTTVEYANEIIKKQFLNYYPRSLLVLDDVWSAHIIKSFDVCARVVVTTQDISVMDVISKCLVKVLKIERGFTLDESLKLFSSYVDIPVEFLPEEAKDIHNECKGSPMVISMIGGLISESGRHSQRQRQSGRWGYYLDSLQSRKFSKFKKQRSYEHTSLFDAVMLSIENLNEFHKKLYKQLAVFLDDVGIPPKKSRRRSFRYSPWLASWAKTAKFTRRRGVRFGGSYNKWPSANAHLFNQYNYKGIHLPFQVLMTYWGMDEYQVEDVMTEFLKKSLAQSEFDPMLDSYVFSIHDLQLEYLKNQFFQDEFAERNMHSHFLQQYFDKVNHKYGLLEDDSYIFYNLGYHLFKSEQFDLFPKIYLDLSFVEAMMKATSSVDLLNDYKRYGDHIIGQEEEFLQDLEDYESFARTVGALVYNTSHADIVQLALSEPEESAVYKAARNLVKERPEQLYFEWTNRHRSKCPHTATILHHGIVEAAAFLPDITNILTTNGDGQVRVWDVRSGEVLHRFTGHKADVKAIALSPDGDIFASGSEDGAVKIWDLGGFQTDEVPPENQHAILRRGSVRGRSHHVTPRTKQTVRSLLTHDHEMRDLSNQSFIFNEHHHEIVLCVAFTPSGEEVVAGGQSGQVKIFNLKARAQRLCLHKHQEAVNSVSVSPNGDFVTSGSDDATIMVWDTDKGDYLASNNLHQHRVTQVIFVDDYRVVSLSADKLIMWDLPNRSMASETASLNVLDFRRTRKADFICVKVSNSCGFLAAATTDNIITLWKLTSAEVILSLPGHTDSIFVLDFTPDDKFLLSGSADETVMVWTLESLSDDSGGCHSLTHDETLPSLGPAFDASFCSDAMTSVLVAPDETNSLRILHDGAPKFQSPPEVSIITCVAIASNHQVVAYGCNNGTVRLYFPSSGAIKHLGRHLNKVKCVAVTMEVIPKLQMEVPVVVSSSRNGMTFWWEGGQAFHCQRVHSSDIQEVKILAHQRLVARSRDNGKVLSLWSLDKGVCLDAFEIDAQNAAAASTTCLANRGNLLAMGTATGLVYVFDVGNDTLNPLKRLQHSSNAASKISGPVRTINFSHDGKLLVCGYDIGDVEAVEKKTKALMAFDATTKLAKRKVGNYTALQVWELSTCTQLYAPLRLHQSWVTDIQFAPDNVHLVTVGDKIAWWCLLNVPKRKSTTTRRTSVSTDPFKRRRRADSESQTSPGYGKTEAGGGCCSQMKVGSGKNKELLQVFHIRGSGIGKIHASQDFRKFVTVDEAGIVYILQDMDSTYS